MARNQSKSEPEQQTAKLTEKSHSEGERQHAADENDFRWENFHQLFDRHGEDDASEGVDDSTAVGEADAFVVPFEQLRAGMRLRVAVEQTLADEVVEEQAVNDVAGPGEAVGEAQNLQRRRQEHHRLDERDGAQMFRLRRLLVFLLRFHQRLRQISVLHFHRDDLLRDRLQHLVGLDHLQRNLAEAGDGDDLGDDVNDGDQVEDRLDVVAQHVRENRRVPVDGAEGEAENAANASHHREQRKRLRMVLRQTDVQHVSPRRQLAHVGVELGEQRAKYRYADGVNQHIGTWIGYRSAVGFSHVGNRGVDDLKFLLVQVEESFANHNRKQTWKGNFFNFPISSELKEPTCYRSDGQENNHRPPSSEPAFATVADAAEDGRQEEAEERADGEDHRHSCVVHAHG